MTDKTETPKEDKDAKAAKRKLEEAIQALSLGASPEERELAKKRAKEWALGSEDANNDLSSFLVEANFEILQEVVRLAKNESSLVDPVIQLKAAEASRRWTSTIVKALMAAEAKKAETSTAFLPPATKSTSQALPGTVDVTASVVPERANEGRSRSARRVTQSKVRRDPKRGKTSSRPKKARR